MHIYMHMCIYVHACTHTHRHTHTHTHACMHVCACVLTPMALLCTAETLIPIIRQSVPDPFPEDMEAEKKDELTRYTTQAIEAIETLQVV